MGKLVKTREQSGFKQTILVRGVRSMGVEWLGNPCRISAGNVVEGANKIMIIINEREGQRMEGRDGWIYAPKGRTKREG